MQVTPTVEGLQSSTQDAYLQSLGESALGGKDNKSESSLAHSIFGFTVCISATELAIQTPLGRSPLGRSPAVESSLAQPEMRGCTVSRPWHGDHGMLR